MASRQRWWCSAAAGFPKSRIAAENVAQAEQAAAADPGNPGLQRQVAIARRILAKSHYYEEARKLGGLLSKIYHHAVLPQSGGHHRRRAGHYGGGKPRRPG